MLYILTIRELRDVRPYAKFKKLFKDVFDTHVRTRPKEFQYCPTPDCQSIYRMMVDGISSKAVRLNWMRQGRWTVGASDRSVPALESTVSGLPQNSCHRRHRPRPQGPRPFWLEIASRFEKTKAFQPFTLPNYSIIAQP